MMQRGKALRYWGLRASPRRITAPSGATTAIRSHCVKLNVVRGIWAGHDVEDRHHNGPAGLSAEDVHPDAGVRAGTFGYEPAIKPLEWLGRAFGRSFCCSMPGSVGTLP